MHAIMTIKKRGYGVEEKWDSVYGKVWSEEKKGRNVIKL